MTDKSVEFENPDNLPAEKLRLTVRNEGVVQQFKALDPHWVEKRLFLPYEQPPSGNSLVFGAIDAWTIRMEAYCENLKWLLSLEHHRFWSTILHHPDCMDCLVSFLQEADPPYLPPHESQRVQKLYNEIRRLVLIVFSRLCTNKESQSRWISREYMAKLIYDNFVYTIPIVWDICLVYGTDNCQHVSRLVNSVFGLQPRYLQDTATALAFVNETFKYIILQVNNDYDNAQPPNLPETFKGFSEIRRDSNKQADKLTFSDLKDLVLHMLDTAMTLRIFIQVYPKSVGVFRETNFVNSIVQLYEYGIPHLYEKLDELGDPASVSCSEVEAHIEMARAEFIDIFREILAVYKNAILSGEDNIESQVEAYLAVMLDVLSERLFIKDYHACHPVHEDLEMLRQAYPNIDSVKIDFILQAIYSNLDEPIPEHLLYNGDQYEQEKSIEDSNEAGQVMDVAGAADNDIPESIREESAISEVKNILPHLGEGFILKCLKHYGFNTEKVVNSILEDSLDASLRGIDQSLPIIPEDALDTNFLETGVARLNVFDGDEFDIMTRDDIDFSRIHKGKRKTKYKDAKEMLDDKTEIKKFADLYTQYSLVADTSVYSDEYDDTYDSDGVPPPVADPTDEARPIVTPRVLRARNQAPSSSSSEDEEEDSRPAASGARNRMDFCVNPEEARARREASYQARRGRGRPGAPPRTVDVQGKPRGQGQEKEVLVNRDRKEKHKSSRGNHNRRQGASWKRSQGMMPS